MNNSLMFLVVLISLHCNTRSLNFSDEKINPPTVMTLNEELVNHIMNDFYGAFYNYSIQAEIIEKIWAEAGGVSPLKAIITNEKIPNKARLIACEVLQQQEFFVLREVGIVDKVAQIYAQALAENTTGMANSWGLLHKHDDVGPVGIHLIMLGEEAIAPLFALLDDDTQYSYYGSEEATVGNGYQFQVRDFAAYYLVKIKNLSKTYYPTREERNVAIQALKEQIAAESK